jgi:hypothetical protein
MEFSQHFFEKYSNMNFHEYPSSGSRDVPCGQTDVYSEANSRFSQFCESTKKGTEITASKGRLNKKNDY